MATEIGVAYLSLVPTFKGLQNNIDSAMRGVDTKRAGASAGEDYSTGFGGAAKKITAALSAAFAAVKVTDFAKSIVSQASDLNEVGTKMAVVFGDANGAVQQFASQGAKALGLSSLQAQNAAANFGVFGKAAGLAGQDQADFSTGMAKLAVDMASFSNTTPDQAIEALSAGLRGESEPLRQYGVLLDDAQLRNEALALGLTDTTKNVLTPQQRVLAAHALILKQTSDAQGDFARTSGGLANQQRILSAQWDDAKGKLGQAFLPAVTSVVSSLNDNLFPALESMGAKASGAWAILAHGDFKGASAGLGEEDSPLVRALFAANDAIVKYGQVIASAWRLLMTGDFQYGAGALGEEDSPLVNLILKVREFGVETFDKLRGIWDTLWATGEKLWPSIKSIAESLGVVFDKIASTGILQFVSAWDLLLLAVQKVADVMQAVLVPVFDWLARFMKENPDAVMAFVVVIGAVVTAIKLWALAQWALNAAYVVFDGLAAVSPFGLIVVAVAALAAAFVWAYQNVDWFRNAVQVAWDVIQNVAGWIKTAFLGVVDFFSNFGDRVGSIVQWFQDLPATIWAAVQSLWANVVEWGSSLISWIWDGIKAGAVAVWQWFLDLPGNLWAAINSGWAQVVEWGHNLLIWILNGIINGAIAVWQWFLDLPSNLWGAIQAAWSASVTWGNQLLIWIGEGITNGAVAVYQWFLDLPGNLWSSIVATWNTVTEWGAHLIGQILEGVKNTASDIWNWFINLPGLVWEKAGAAWDTFVDWGKGVVARIVEGINSVKDTVKTAILGLFDFTVSDNDTNVQRLKDLANGGSIIPGLGGGARGAVVPGTDPGRRDNTLMAVRSGESIFVPEFTQAIGGASTVHAWNRAAESGTLGRYLPGMALGGVVDQELFDFGARAGGIWGDTVTGQIKDGRAATIARAITAGGGGSIGGGVEQWRSTALAALAVAGQSASWVDDLLIQMTHESSGDPNIGNFTDINAVHGDPSIGLMQVIGSTFRNALNSHGFGVYVPLGQTNPFANILASILYTVDRYGDLGAWRRGDGVGVPFGAYDQGGILGAGSFGVNLLNKPEAVLTPDETLAYKQHAESLARGFGGQRIEVTFAGDGPITAEMARTARYVIVDALDAEAFHLDVAGAQS